MYIFSPPLFTILVSHSLRSGFKVAEAPSSLLSLGIFDSGMTLKSFVSTNTLWLLGRTFYLTHFRVDVLHSLMIPGLKARLQDVEET